MDHVVDTVNYNAMPSIHPGDALHRLLHAYKHAMRDASRDAGIELPVSHMRMLKVVCHHPRCTAHDVATHWRRDKAQIARVVKELDHAQLIRIQPDPDDGRRRILTPTAAGTRMFQRIADAERAAGARMVHGLAPDAVDRFVELAEAMATNLRKS